MDEASSYQLEDIYICKVHEVNEHHIKGPVRLIIQHSGLALRSNRPLIHPIFHRRNNKDYAISHLA